MESLPGFHAEASLRYSGRSYRMAIAAQPCGDVRQMLNGQHLTQAADLKYHDMYALSISCEERYRDCLEKCRSYKPPLTGGGGQWGEGILDENLGVVGGSYSAYCRLQCENAFNCGSDRACILGYCCNKDRACGTRCCGPTEVCLGPSQCCPQDQVCGSTCCHAPGRCTSEGCCPPGREVCNGRCCPPNERCSAEGCCPAARVNASGHCCSVGTVACGNTCCGENEICTAEGCCPKGKCCNFAGECAPGTFCCGGQICCKDGRVCKLVYGTEEHGCFS